MVNLGQRPSVWWVLIIAVLTLVIFFFIVDYTTLLAVNNVFTDLQDSILITCNEFSTFQFYGTPPTTYNDFSKPTFAWQLSVCFGVTLSNCNDPGKYSPPGAQGLNYISVVHDDIPTNWVMNFSLNSISYVAISGTFWKWQWYQDMNFREPVESQLFGKSVQVHAGFYGMYMSFRPQLLTLLASLPADQPVVIMGHSLGAALATMCFADVMNNSLLTQPYSGLFIASPRVGNQAFASMVDNATSQWYRVTNDSDMVTQIPFPVMGSNIIYEHVGSKEGSNVRWFNNNTGSLAKNHTLAYMVYAGVKNANQNAL